jgi:hypothetical protein
VAENETKKKLEIPRLSDEDIKTIASDLVKGQIFTGNDCPPDMLTVVFFPLLAMVAEYELDWDQVGNVIEYMHKSAERGINGYPFFFSCRLIHKDDWSQIAERALKIHNAMQEAMQ